MPIVKFCCGIVWGIIADKYRCRKKINLITVICSVSIICLLAFASIANSYRNILIISASASAFTSAGVLDAYCLDLLGKKH